MAWLEAMSASGSGKLIEMSGTEALDIAKNAQPVAEPKLAAMHSDGLATGDKVEIMPIDYGLQPTSGELLIASLEELAVLREDPQVGRVAVHFPRLGFQVTKSS